MKYLLVVLLMSLGCADLKQELAPDVIFIENSLNKDLRTLLEMTIESEVCHLVEKEGFVCNIPEQLESIKFVWPHDGTGAVNYELLFCLKDDCPKE